MTTVDAMILSFQLSPIANAGPDGEICSNETFAVSGTAYNNSYTYWNTNGDGEYDDRFS